MKIKIAIYSLMLMTICQAQEMTGPEIILKVNNLINPKSTFSKAKMKIITSSGKERIFIYDSWTKNHGEKTLIKYSEPRRVKDQATLLLNHADDIWMYFPRTDRVRKLATHAKKQKMEGSDFSYEDMGAGNAFIEDFIAKRLEDKKISKQSCYQVELTRNPESDISYSRLLIFVLKDNYVPILIRYYDEKHPDRLIKELHQSEIQVIEDIPTAMKMVMLNKSDNTQTIMELIDVSYNISLNDQMFTERGLKK